MPKRDKATGDKTNAMRMLDAAGIVYEVRRVETDGSMTGLELAQALGQDPEQVFKTLVTVGKSGEHYVFMVPVEAELDLKKAAASVGEKSVAMIRARELLPLTGYIHGGCSPLGMKKVFRTVIDETATLFETIMCSAGHVGWQVELSLADLQSLVNVEVADITG